MSETTAARKQELRTAISAQRVQCKAQPGAQALLDESLLSATLDCLAHFGVSGSVAAYAPLPSEPGPADFPARLAAAGHKVWLPISLPNGILAWAQADGATRPGALGITEPSGPRFNSNVLKSCELILAPAMAVDVRGMRLGKGAGYYDRALAGLEVPVAAVVYDEECLDAVPHDPHDVPVSAVITPSSFKVISRA